MIFGLPLLRIISLTLIFSCYFDRERFGSFMYAAPRTPYTLQQNKSGLLSESSATARSPSSSSKLSRQRKKLLNVKNLSSSVAAENDSRRRAVKLVVRLSSTSNKQPSVVSKTASALKLRYSSIISTRRGSAAATSKSDSAVEKSAMITGCREVTDCVVSVERVGSGVAAVNCIDEVGADTSQLPCSGNEQSEQNKAAEHDNTLCPDVDDTLHTNTIPSADTAEIEGGKENESLSNSTVMDENDGITESNVRTWSQGKCEADDELHLSVIDELTVEDSNGRVAAVTIHDNEFTVVTSAPSTAASDTQCTVTTASDKVNTASANNCDKGLIIGTVECSNLPSTADVASIIGNSEAKYVSVDSIVTNVSSDVSSMPGSVSGMNTVTSQQVCHTTKHNVDTGRQGASAVKACITATEENSSLNDKMHDEAQDCLLDTCSHSVSECNYDSAGSNVNSMSVDEVVNRNPVEMDCCHMSDDVTVAGILSTGTDLDCDSMATLQRDISTVCHVSPSSIATTATHLQSTDTASSVSCSTPRFPFLEFLMTQSKSPTVTNAAALQSSPSVTCSLSAHSANSTVAPATSATCSPGLSASTESHSVSQTALSLPSQPSSTMSQAVFPSSRHCAVSKPLSTGMFLPDLFRIL